MTTYECIDKNIESFKDLVRIGIVSTTVLSYYNIYCVYRSASNIESRMNRLYFAADVCKVTPGIVRNAIRMMNLRVSDYKEMV